MALIRLTQQIPHRGPDMKIERYEDKPVWVNTANIVVAQVVPEIDKVVVTLANGMQFPIGEEIRELVALFDADESLG